MVSRFTSERDFPGFERLFKVQEPATKRPFRASVADARIRQALRAEFLPEEPIAASWYMGATTPGDIIRTGWAGPLIVSERVLAVLREHGISGWRTYPVRLAGKRGEMIPGYHGLAVTGRCGPIDYRRSVKFLKQYPALACPEFLGLYFDEDSWDGSDLFMSSDPTTSVFCMESTKRAFEQARIGNIVFLALSSVEISPDASPILQARVDE